MTEIIHFYLVDEAYGEFSNFAEYPIAKDGKLWPTSEHYFQAQKFSGRDDEEEIRTTESPMAAALLGRDRNRPLRTDWESVKVEMMRRALHAKFTQHPELVEMLLSTADAKIVEHTKNDSYWGDGGHGNGRNMLGQLLMELRDQLKNAEQL